MRSTSEHRRRSGTALTGVVEQWIPPIAQTLSGAFPSFKFWHNPDLQPSLELGPIMATLPTFGAECLVIAAFQTWRRGVAKVGT